MTAPIDLVLPRLTGVIETSNGWDALCPAHDDSRPSLGVAVTEDGTVLLKCRSHGCSADAICRAIGLKLADLFPPESRNGSPRKGFNIAATYDYLDNDGTLLYQVVRLDPKGFRQRQPDPKGRDGWSWHLKGVKRVLYRLAEVQRACSEGVPIFVVEGEKDADNLAHPGLVATTNSGGAGKWQKGYSDTLAGAEVIILPDNDEPGQDHAEKVARSLSGKAKSVKVLNLPDLPPKGDVSDWLAAGGNADQLLEMVAPTPEWTGAEKESGESAESGTYGDTRPKIIITTEEHEVNEQAAAALARDTGIYQRGGLLVRVVRDSSLAAGAMRRPNAPKIEPLPSALLRDRLAANVRWVVVQESKEGTEERPARPPGWCVSAVHARGEWRGLRHLEAVVEYPVLRTDGTVLVTPGFDPATGLLYESSQPPPVLPANPSLADAEAARDALLEVVVDFPFDREIHRSAWLAALLTPLARFAFQGPAPLFLVDSNIRGAGKGLLCESIARIITGKTFVIATYTDDQDELRKRITSLALSGDRLVLFDNLEGKFGNAVLDAALTAVTWKDRVLGVNRMMEAPLFMTWFATGNNVLIGADTSRRVCHVRLESPDEKPEERRDFKYPDLLRWIDANQPRLLAAALTMLRAYCLAGRPSPGLTPWGSFDGWSNLVRSAVVWCGMPDPGETRIVLQEQADSSAESMALLLLCWSRMDPNGKGLTAAEVIHRLYKEDPPDPPDYYRTMKAAIETLLAKPDARSLGNKLRIFRRRIFQGRFIDKAGEGEQGARWVALEACRLRRPQDSPDSRDGISAVPPPADSPDSADSFSAGAVKASEVGREVFEV
jgi:hypothetical protein